LRDFFFSETSRLTLGPIPSFRSMGTGVLGRIWGVNVAKRRDKERFYILLSFISSVMYRRVVVVISD